MLFRVCTVCGGNKEIGEFYTHSSSGRPSPRCKRCDKAKVLARRRNYYQCKRDCSEVELYYDHTENGIDIFRRAGCNNVCCREEAHNRGDETHFCAYHKYRIFVKKGGMLTRIRTGGRGAARFDRIDVDGKQYDGAAHEVYFMVDGRVRRR